ncbi:hypothetical protein J6590_007308 [Homalodisca vitripennis]|nr:hypothetical protein J6590_007302 [Homalodisca vitripennis]KAG8298723.1 hypothetical protein J6590_007308 [Homalodisca vitripennis]
MKMQTNHSPHPLYSLSLNAHLCDVLQEQRSLKAGEITQQESQNMSAATMRLQTDSFTAEKLQMQSKAGNVSMTATLEEEMR